VLAYVISSRVRLARNLSNYHFPHIACDNERKAILKNVQTAAKGMGWFHDVHCVHLDTLDPLDRRILEEKHLISPLLAKQGIHRLAIIAKACDFSILVNEEDHLRIQAIRPGMQIRQTWDIARKLERGLRERLDFAHSEQYGYLTVCSSNAGTGIRASVMMFLPGLIILKRITPILQNIISLGYTVRGMYGEGSKSQGYLLQISRQGTYGKNEVNILRSLEGICYRIIQEERRARVYLLMRAGRRISDYVRQIRHRLSMAKQVTFNEGMRILAILRLGITLRMEQCRLGENSDRMRNWSCTLKHIDEVFTHIQPAHIFHYGLRERQRKHLRSHYLLKQDSEEAIRAKILQHALNNRLHVLVDD
jgi:protein arginine kinase